MPAPDGACAEHPGARASFECPRCGDFGCLECERRVTPTAMPICPQCWAQRSREVEIVEAKQRRYLPKVALGIGIAALIPCIWPLQVGGIVVSILALRRAQGDPTARTYAVIGLVLSIVGLVESFAVISLGGAGIS